MELDPQLLPDHMGHAARRPQIGVEAVLRRLLGQPPENLLLLGGAQERRATGVRFAGEAFVTIGPVRPDPLVDRDRMDPEKGRDVGLTPTVDDPLHRLSAPSFHARCGSCFIHDADGLTYLSSTTQSE